MHEFLPRTDGHGGGAGIRRRELDLGHRIGKQVPGSGAPMQFPLPQPLQNPITLLTGNGHQQQAEPCAASVDFDETFTRTGD
jgi:hypothetical protein